MKFVADWSLKHFRQSDELAVRLRAEVIYRFSIMFVCMISGILILSFLAPSPGASRATLIVSIGLFFLPVFLLRRCKSTQPAALTFLGTMFVTQSVYVVVSGFPIHPTISLWFVSLVIITDLLLGRKLSIGLTVATFIVFGSASLAFQAGWGIREAVKGEIILDIWFTNILFVMNLWAVLHILKQHHMVHKQLQEEAESRNQQVSSLLEEQRVLNKKLQKSNLQAQDAVIAKSQFLSTMSHEIRTPMNAVIGMTSLLEQTHLSEEQAGLVDTVKLSGENLLRIINDILDFSKIEAGKLELDIQPFSVAKAVEDALDLLSGKATEKGLELMYSMEGEVPEAIAADLTRVRQILINLTNNAIKFTEEGEILVRVSSKGMNDSKHVLEFEVRDTGIGISEEEQNRLFHSFSQVDATTTRKYGGTGLGLAISKRLAELMGGEIWLESLPGQGSTFFFTIHADVVEGYQHPDPISGPKKGTGQQILVVDDNQTNREILKAQCINWGYKPVLAESAEQASSVLEDNHDIQLIILDYQMPGKDGLTFARETRQSRSINDLPILMLTSLGMPLDPASRKYINEYLHKPAKANQLQGKLSELLSSDILHNHSSSSVQASDEKAYEGKAISILVVEDNLVNQKVALKMLKKLGLEPDIAADGQKAINALKNKSYDLLLMDMQMPVMDGLTATRIIRDRSEEFGDPVIIAMTANAFLTDQEACMEAGMEDFLSKPVRFEDLRMMLDKWLNQPVNLDKK